MRNGSIRASDSDREGVVAALRDHAVAGRLTPDELEERSGRALDARTLGELDTLLADLPQERAVAPAPARATALLIAEGVLWVAVAATIAMIAILCALAWAGARLARLAASAAARSLDSGRRPELRAGDHIGR